MEKSKSQQPLQNRVCGDIGFHGPVKNLYDRQNCMLCEIIVRRRTSSIHTFECTTCSKILHPRIPPLVSYIHISLHTLWLSHETAVTCGHPTVCDGLDWIKYQSIHRHRRDMIYVDQTGNEQDGQHRSNKPPTAGGYESDLVRTAALPSRDLPEPDFADRRRTGCCVLPIGTAPLELR